jgi:isopenicillin N synthase-like dioxygenase
MNSTKFNLHAGIPTLDLRRFTGGDDTERQKFADELGAAFRQVGFAAISSHGVPQELIEKMYSEVKSFFTLEREVKHSYCQEGNQRGFVKFGQEHAKGNESVDLKEFWQVGQTVIPPGSNMIHYPPNVSVDEFPDFSLTSDKLYQALETSGVIVLEALAMHLKLPLDYFTEKIWGGNSILRAIHYPPIKSEPDTSVRAAAHEDINLITRSISFWFRSNGCGWRVE